MSLGERPGHGAAVPAGDEMTFANMREFTSMVPNLLVIPAAAGIEGTRSCTFYGKDGEGNAKTVKERRPPAPIF
jgi:hypothetical protein